MARTLGSGSAEFVIVVLGVLVALAADSAMDGLRARDTRQSALEALRRDVLEDLSQLDTRLPFLADQRRAHEYLRAFLTSSGPIADSAAFVEAVALVASYQTFDGNTAAIEDLTSTGTLRLVQDDRLRSEILDYYNVVEDVREVDEAYRTALLQNVWTLYPRIVGGVALALQMETRYDDSQAGPARAAAATALDAQQIRDNGALRELLLGTTRGLLGQRSNHDRLRVAGETVLERLDAAIGGRSTR